MGCCEKNEMKPSLTAVCQSGKPFLEDTISLKPVGWERENCIKDDCAEAITGVKTLRKSYLEAFE